MWGQQQDSSAVTSERRGEARSQQPAAVTADEAHNEPTNSTHNETHTCTASRLLVAGLLMSSPYCAAISLSSPRALICSCTSSRRRIFSSSITPSRLCCRQVVVKGWSREQGAGSREEQRRGQRTAQHVSSYGTGGVAAGD